MNLVKFENTLTMTSREIADLVNSRHDNVRRTIERLAAGGIIQLPPLEGVKNHLGQTVEVYTFAEEKGKRDSLVVVAQLSPEFTGALIDRWQELEVHVANHKQARLEGKAARKKETDSIKALVEYAEANGSQSAKMYYLSVTKMTNSLLGVDAAQRDDMDANQLKLLLMVETGVDLAIQRGIKDGLPYKEIYKLAKAQAESITQLLLN